MLHFGFLRCCILDFCSGVLSIQCVVFCKDPCVQRSFGHAGNIDGQIRLYDFNSAATLLNIFIGSVVYHKIEGQIQFYDFDLGGNQVDGLPLDQ